MRGVVSAGMLLGLEALGFRECFDEIYGTSSGAANAAYFLSDQASLGASIYYEFPKRYRSIVKFSRLLYGKPVVDLNGLFSAATFAHFPLDFAEFVNCGIPLTVLASEIDQPEIVSSETTQLRRLTNFRDQHDLLLALHASAQLPAIAGPPVEYNGMKLLDGGVIEEVPVYAAIADNYTHILALVTLPEGVEKYQVARWIERMYILPRLGVVAPGLAQMLATRHNRYRATLDLLRKKRADQEGPPYITFVTLPSSGPRVNAFETRRSKLVSGAIAGVHAALRSFSPGPFAIHDLLTIVDVQGKYGRTTIAPNEPRVEE